MTRAALATALATLIPAGPLSAVWAAGSYALCAVGVVAMAVFVALAAHGRRIAPPLEDECAPTHSEVRARKRSVPAGAGADGRLAAAARGSLVPCEGAPQDPERRIAREGAAGSLSSGEA